MDSSSLTFFISLKRRPLAVRSLREYTLETGETSSKIEQGSQMGKKKKENCGPRLDPHKRLLARFYEPLVLLHVLDPNGAQQSSCYLPEDWGVPSLPLRELRRNFLEQLAYICDFDKGGDTVTAIALQAHPSQVIYWIASNQGPCDRVVSFLEEILILLRTFSLSSSEDSKELLEEQLASRCIAFSFKRIKTYQILIQKPLNNCLNILSRSMEEKDQRLKDWLHRFQNFGEDRLSLCRFSYKERRCQFMIDLQNHIGDRSEEANTPGSKREAFSLVRHWIGRLGAHFRAARILAAAAWRLPDLFYAFTIQCRPSPKPPSSPPPIDQLTTLEGILKRMHAGNSAELKQYQEALAFMNTKFKILDRLLALYKDKTFRPRVHAELTLLEFFYANGLPFIEDDRFIACSKPACYCCYHYICAHPGGFVRPSSHGIRYLNWRPPDVIDTTNDFEEKRQYDVLNQMIKVIRRDALRQIEQRQGPSKWRPDSTTGITYSVKEHSLESRHEKSWRQEEIADYNESTANFEVGMQPGEVSTAMYEDNDILESDSNAAIDSSDSSDSDGGVAL